MGAAWRRLDRPDRSADEKPGEALPIERRTSVQRQADFFAGSGAAATSASQ